MLDTGRFAEAVALRQPRAFATTAPLSARRHHRIAYGMGSEAKPGNFSGELGRALLTPELEKERKSSFSSTPSKSESTPQTSDHLKTSLKPSTGPEPVSSAASSWAAVAALSHRIKPKNKSNNLQKPKQEHRRHLLPALPPGLNPVFLHLPR